MCHLQELPASVTFSLFCCPVTNESGCCCYRTSPWHNAYDQHKALSELQSAFPHWSWGPQHVWHTVRCWWSQEAGSACGQERVSKTQHTAQQEQGRLCLSPQITLLLFFLLQRRLALSLAACGDHHRRTFDPHQLTTNLSLQLWGFSAVLLFVHLHSAVIFSSLAVGNLSLISFMHSFPSLFSPTLPTSTQTLCWHQTVRRIIWVITGLLLTCVSCKNPDLSVVPHFSVPQLVSTVQTRYEGALLFRCDPERCCGRI